MNKIAFAAKIPGVHVFTQVAAVDGSSCCAVLPREIYEWKHEPSRLRYIQQTNAVAPPSRPPLQFQALKVRTLSLKHTDHFY